MESFRHFAVGVALAIGYGALALLLANSVLSVSADLWALCLLTVILGWVAIAVIAFRNEQRWIGYGVLAAPFIVLIGFTVSCFVAFNVNSAA